MSVTFPCPKCGRELRTKGDPAGRRFKCPSCGHGFRMPAEEAEEESPRPARKEPSGSGFGKAFAITIGVVTGLLAVPAFIFFVCCGGLGGVIGITKIGSEATQTFEKQGKAKTGTNGKTPPTTHPKR